MAGWRGWVRIEPLLAVAVVALLCQVFPSLWASFVSAVDVRGWSRADWLSANVVVLAGLVGLRFRAEFAAIGRRLARRNHERGQAMKPPGTESTLDYEARRRRDAEWRERAKKRLPFT